MGKKSGGSQAQSSNPQWLDDAGQELWNFAKDVVFMPNDATSGTAGATASTGTSYGGGLPPGVQFVGGQGDVKTYRDPSDLSFYYVQPDGSVTTSNGYNPATPYTGASGSSASGSATPGAMSADNVRPLQTYGGERVAGATNNQNEASRLAYNAAQSNTDMFDRGAGYVDQSTSRFGKAFDPNKVSADQVSAMMVDTNRFDQGALDQYMSPFVGAALQTTSDEMARQAQMERLKMNSGMVSKGAFGGSRHGVVESNLNRDLLDRTGAMFRQGMTDAYDRAMAGFQADESRLLQAGMANQGAKLSADQGNQSANLTADTYNEDNRFRAHESNRDQFNTEQNRLLQAASAMGNLGTAKSNVASQDIERLLRTGETQRSLEQQELDTKYQDFLEQRDWPFTQLERLAGVVNGSPSRGSITHQQKPSTLSQLAGTAMAGASLYSAFSDDRLKENISVVDVKDGIDIIEFNYRGSPTRYRGVSAKQVKEVRPDAVIRRDNGFDAVDYAAIDIPFITLGVQQNV